MHNILRFLISLACLVPLMLHAQAMTTWTEYSVLGFNADNSKRPTIVFNTTSYPVGSCPGYDGTAYSFYPCNFAQDVWVEVSLAQFGVPASAGEIFVQGIMIVSPAVVAGTPDVWFQCRAPQSTLPAGSYQAQAIGQVTYIQSDRVFVGARSSVGMWCPVRDGKVQFYWHASGPSDAAFGINLSLQAYAR